MPARQRLLTPIRIFSLTTRTSHYSVDYRRNYSCFLNDHLIFSIYSRMVCFSSGIPGEVYGYWKAHQLGGRLQWSQLFEPIIKLCESGHRVSKTVATILEREKRSILKDRGLSSTFVNPQTGSVYKEGNVITRSNYASTLRTISRLGYRALYDGPLTRLMVDEINENGTTTYICVLIKNLIIFSYLTFLGGNVTLQDFRIYEPRVDEDRFVVKLDDEYRVYAVPPPSSGILISIILRIIKR